MNQLAHHTSSTHRGWASRTRSVSVVCIAFLALASFAAATASAADHPLAAYAGKYKFKGTEDDAKAIIEKAYDDGLKAADMNMVMRAMIKKAVVETRGPFARPIVIETPPGKIGIQVGKLPMVHQTPGVAQKHTRDGKSAMVTHKYSGGKITTVSEGDEGSMTSVLKLAADGKTLTVDVTVKSPRLKVPVKYSMTYTKG